MVLALFKAHHNLDNPTVAAANMMGLQVLKIGSDDFFGRTIMELHVADHDLFVEDP